MDDPKDKPFDFHGREVLLAWQDEYMDATHADDPGALKALVDRDLELLRPFGVLDAGLGNGAQLFTPHEGRTTCNLAGWNWLRPLLVELAEYREALAEGKCLPSSWREGEKE
jgi:hypothetical protein